uniref:Uncharacterized protein n=1 Tax=Lotharella globosa TaxID=91324 RepID=A0A7S3YMZ6_9EUKA
MDGKISRNWAQPGLEVGCFLEKLNYRLVLVRPLRSNASARFIEQDVIMGFPCRPVAVTCRVRACVRVCVCVREREREKTHRDTHQHRARAQTQPTHRTRTQLANTGHTNHTHSIQTHR